MSRVGRPKLLLPWRNTTVVGSIISQWRELGAAQIAIVLRPEDPALIAELDSRGISRSDRVENPQSERGMFSSIVCAANWNGWRQEILNWAIVLGDQPHLQTETLGQLLAVCAKNPDAICQPALGGSKKHPVILPTRAFAGLKTTAAESLKEFLNLTDCPRIQCSVADTGLSLDLDTPEDYKRLTNHHLVA